MAKAASADQFAQPGMMIFSSQGSMHLSPLPGTYLELKHSRTRTPKLPFASHHAIILSESNAIETASQVNKPRRDIGTAEN
ncbi:uncharacterized protein PgNI_02260 [Pyricularia grisea]|uniref:Uncharacterized protein n=1 Tax=Pyricularia grisea TaxID=148305 RepID=A0A6P8BGU3_PYRGI|nr:uncharacterized protein PgNI_02260 [Pyricularia grisea]TLD15839.1 hypothetical protein PgNI_02260 [Pyricularia grisea]